MAIILNFNLPQVATSILQIISLYDPEPPLQFITDVNLTTAIKQPNDPTFSRDTTVPSAGFSHSSDFGNNSIPGIGLSYQNNLPLPANSYLIAKPSDVYNTLTINDDYSVLQINAAIANLEPGFNRIRVDYQWYDNVNILHQDAVYFDVPFYEGWDVTSRELNNVVSYITGRTYNGSVNSSDSYNSSPGILQSQVKSLDAEASFITRSALWKGTTVSGQMLTQPAKVSVFSNSSPHSLPDLLELKDSIEPKLPRKLNKVVILNDYSELLDKGLPIDNNQTGTIQSPFSGFDVTNIQQYNYSGKYVMVDPTTGNYNACIYQGIADGHKLNLLAMQNTDGTITFIWFDSNFFSNFGGNDYWIYCYLFNFLNAPSNAQMDVSLPSISSYPYMAFDVTVRSNGTYTNTSEVIGSGNAQDVQMQTQGGQSAPLKNPSLFDTVTAGGCLCNRVLFTPVNYTPGTTVFNLYGEQHYDAVARHGFAGVKNSSYFYDIPAPGFNLLTLYSPNQIIPSIASVNNGGAICPGQTITVIGENFYSGVTNIYINNTSVPSTIVSENELTFVYNNYGTYNLTIQNNGVPTVASQSITIYSSPVITSVNGNAVNNTGYISVYANSTITVLGTFGSTGSIQYITSNGILYTLDSIQSSISWTNNFITFSTQGFINNSSGSYTVRLVGQCGFAQFNITIIPLVLTINPNPTQLSVGSTTTFSAYLNGSLVNATWSKNSGTYTIDGTTYQTYGNIDSSTGLYTAPPYDVNNVIITASYVYNNQNYTATTTFNVVGSFKSFQIVPNNLPIGIPSSGNTTRINLFALLADYLNQYPVEGTLNLDGSGDVTFSSGTSFSLVSPVTGVSISGNQLSITSSAINGSTINVQATYSWNPNPSLFTKSLTAFASFTLLSGSGDTLVINPSLTSINTQTISPSSTYIANMGLNYPFYAYFQSGLLGLYGDNVSTSVNDSNSGTTTWNLMAYINGNGWTNIGNGNSTYGILSAGSNDYIYTPPNAIPPGQNLVYTDNTYTIPNISQSTSVVAISAIYNYTEFSSANHKQAVQYIYVQIDKNAALSISPNNAFLTIPSSQQFSATLLAPNYQGVNIDGLNVTNSSTWSVSGAINGNISGSYTDGSIDNNGFYITPFQLPPSNNGIVVLSNGASGVNVPIGASYYLNGITYTSNVSAVVSNYIANTMSIYANTQINIYLGDGRFGYIPANSFCAAQANNYVYVQFKEKIDAQTNIPDKTYLPIQQLTMFNKSATDSDIGNVIYDNNGVLQSDGTILTTRTIILGIVDNTDGYFHSMWDIANPYINSPSSYYLPYHFSGIENISTKSFDNQLDTINNHSNILLIGNCLYNKENNEFEIIDSIKVIGLKNDSYGIVGIVPKQKIKIESNQYLFINNDYELEVKEFKDIIENKESDSIFVGNVLDTFYTSWSLIKGLDSDISGVKSNKDINYVKVGPLLVQWGQTDVIEVPAEESIITNKIEFPEEYIKSCVVMTDIIDVDESYPNCNVNEFSTTDFDVNIININNKNIQTKISWVAIGI